MNSRNPDAAWNMKGGTLSDKSARKEFGLTQEEIIKGINRGDLQYRVNAIHGNPFLRLIRSEVEAFVKKEYGKDHLTQKKYQNELRQIEKELKSLEQQIATLRMRRAGLLPLLTDKRHPKKPHNKKRH